MDTKEREKDTSAAERRRRMEARRRREKARRRKKIRRLITIAIILVVVVIAAAAGVLLFKKFSGGSKEIAAKNGTYVIAIDPGHGGEDTGMSSEFALEKDVTMDISSKLKVMLESQGYQVVMTREDDSRQSKEDRVAAANASSADLLVSIHCGYSEDSSKSGAVTYYEKDSKESKTLAENIQAAVIKENGALDGGAAEGSYSIVNDTEMPAVLIEVGYLSNSNEAGSLADDSYQNDTAKGIAKGIILSLAE